jgi:hypothetical protein
MNTDDSKSFMVIIEHNGFRFNIECSSRRDVLEAFAGCSMLTDSGMKELQALRRADRPSAQA